MCLEHRLGCLKNTKTLISHLILYLVNNISATHFLADFPKLCYFEYLIVFVLDIIHSSYVVVAHMKIWIFSIKIILIPTRVNRLTHDRP